MDNGKTRGDEFWRKFFGAKDHADWLDKNALDFDNAKKACEVCMENNNEQF